MCCFSFFFFLAPKNKSIILTQTLYSSLGCHSGALSAENQWQCLFLFLLSFCLLFGVFSSKKQEWQRLTTFAIVLTHTLYLRLDDRHSGLLRAENLWPWGFDVMTFCLFFIVCLIVKLQSCGCFLSLGALFLHLFTLYCRWRSCCLRVCFLLVVVTVVFTYKCCIFLGCTPVWKFYDIFTIFYFVCLFKCSSNLRTPLPILKVRVSIA